MIEDTSGADEHREQRMKCYENSDVFMLCLSKDQNNSGDDCVGKWIREIRSIEPNKPIVLILTKKDLKNKNYFTEERLEQIKIDYKLQQVCSTSSKDDQNSVLEAFDESIRQACE